jgi:hypothetical protein
MAGHTDGLAIMLAWTANPSPVMCPAWSMQPLPVWTATLPSADDRDLAQERCRVGRGRLVQRLGRRCPGRQRVQAAGAVGGVGERLGGDRPHPRTGAGDGRADAKEAGLDGDAEGAVGGVAGHDRVAHWAVLSGYTTRVRSGSTISWSAVAPVGRCTASPPRPGPRPGRAAPMSEHGPPERHHLGADQRVDRDLDGLEHGRVGGEAQLAGHRRDPPGQLEVAPAQAVVVVGDRDQPHGHARMPDVEVGMVGVEAVQLSDRLREPGPGRE